MTSSLTITRSALWGSLGAGGGAALQLLSLIALASLLGPSDFGVAMVSIAIVYTFDALVQNFFEKALVQREQLDDIHVDTAFCVSVVAGGAIIALCMLGADVVAAFFREPELAPLLRWMSPVLLFGGFNSVVVAVLRRRMQFKPIAISTFVGRAIGTILAIGMAVAGFGVWSFVAQQIGWFGGTAAALWVTSSCRPRLRFSMRHLRELGGFAVPNGLSRVVEVAAGHVVVLVAARLFGPISLGYFSLAARVSSTLGQIDETLSRQISLSVFARQQRRHEALRESVTMATGLTGLLAFPIFLGLALFATEIVTVVFGLAWLPAVPLIQLFAAGFILHIVISPTRAAIDAVGRPGWHLLRNTADLLISIIGLLVLAEVGVVATGIVFLLASVLTIPIDLLVAREFLRMRPTTLLARLTGPLVGSGLSAAAVTLARARLFMSWEPATRLVVLAPVGALLYFALLWWLQPQLVRDIATRLLETIGPVSRGAARKRVRAALPG